MSTRLATGLMTGLATALLLFGLVYGAAASLSLNDVSDVGAVSATISACDSDGIDIDVASADGLTVSTVTIGGLADLCDGLTVTAVIAGNTVSGTVTSDGGDANSVQLDFSGAGLSLSSLTSIDVSIL